VTPDSAGPGRRERGYGVVTLTVGDVGRSGAQRRRTGAGDGQDAQRPVAQWTWDWSPEGPGTIRPGSQGEADLALGLSRADADLVRDGLLSPSVAFMQGRLKTSGDNELLLGVLRWTAQVDLAAFVRGAQSEVGTAVPSTDAPAAPAQ
jgi:hypothetical protein